ncbi:hypothetical protein [Tabrizicola sp.]|jgi:hypothetical protein|uniref:hypothetical protein n=1 Tax=Tabrizicola sp. TaxID=2005166 RepID=UPI0035B10FF4
MTPHDPAISSAAALSLEGRILAHRRLLVELLRRLPDDVRAHLADWLDQHALYQDGQEDPGAVPGDAVALELARADEFRALAEMFSAGSR